MKLRIAHVISTPSGAGGAERVLAALVAAGESAGWDQLVLNPFAADPSVRLSGIGASVPFSARPGARLVEFPILRRWLHSELVSFDPNIVHVHLFHALIAVSTLRKRKARWVLTHHHGDFLEAQGRSIDSALDRILGRRYDTVIAVSDAVHRFLVERYRYPSDKIRVIHNGWEGRPSGRVGAALHPTVVSVGNLRPEKGHEVLLRAFAQVRDRIGDARLRLVGGGPLEAHLKRRAGELEIFDSVDFVGPVPNVWSELERAHVFAFPSLSEPLGIAVMEAMAAGLPVVATQVGGIPEIVRAGVTGYLVPPGDAAWLASRLIDLLSSPQECEYLGAAARVAADDMTMDKTVTAYRRLYADILAQT